MKSWCGVDNTGGVGSTVCVHISEAGCFGMVFVILCVLLAVVVSADPGQRSRQYPVPIDRSFFGVFSLLFYHDAGVYCNLVSLL